MKDLEPEVREITNRAARADDGAGQERLGDFTTTPRVLAISLLATGIGIFSAFVALGLLRLIGLFTNLFFFGRWQTSLVSPAGHSLGVFVILVPVAGALVIGVMARYGSERIRGHGIPEAIEAILINGSRVEPRVAFLKPLSSAISIGSGGPFGAEGPIIMTGGAFGSMIAQFFHLTSTERKTLLVAGAAGGMSATFASPVAAVLLGVELLLFEWKPRSLIPVALASAAAAATRRYIIGLGPLFPTPPHPVFIGPKGLLGCVLVGLLAGALSALLTISVYAAEDAFNKLPIHWMWWPAIGGVAVGLGGLVFPQALGVGYDTIADLLQGTGTTRLILGVLLVKWFIWAFSLGSGTSGGVLAPLLMREYAVDPLEILFVRDVMRTNIVALPADLSPAGLAQSLRSDSVRGGQHLFPIVDAGGCVAGVVTRKDLRKLIEKPLSGGEAHGFAGLVRRNPVVAYADEPLRVVVYRMAEKGVTRMPVVEREDCPKLLGMVALSDLLKARVRNLEEERRRERVLPLHLVFPLGARRSKGSQVN